MTNLRFERLNHDWNAEPNAPCEWVEVVGTDVVFRFYLNHWRYPQFGEQDLGVLTFSRCSRWRIGDDNMDAFALRQAVSRYCRAAPSWGEFYELSGEDPLRNAPEDWHRLVDDTQQTRHFLFYLRDSSFECEAAGWAFAVDRGGAVSR